MDPADPYDRLPYTEHAYAETHPDRLATVARLSGWEAPAVETARVLELGCGRGGNLLPMASSLPGASFLGIDRSEVQIAEARRLAAEVALERVRFERADVEGLEVGAEHDFVLAHGLCSWIVPAARRALLATVARALAPGGVAYVSFNVLPGWYDRMAARDWLRAFPPAPGGASASVAWLRDAVSPELADYRRRLGAVAARLAETDRAYAEHEYLAAEHHPQAVSELLAEARDAGLVYLGDAIPSETALELLPGEVSERARRLDVAGAQQLVDFVTGTAFRRTLLVRAKDAAERGWRWPARLVTAAAASLRVASRLRPRGPERPGAPSEQFEGVGTAVDLADFGLRRALHQLARAAPRSLPVATLPGPELPEALVDLWLATGAVDLHAYEPALGSAADPFPAACPLVRWRARHGGPLTNRWHHEVRLDDPLQREVLARLDGRTSIAELAGALAAHPDGSKLEASERSEWVRASVTSFAAAALLVPAPPRSL